MNIRKWAFTDNKAIEKLEKAYFEDPWNMQMLSGSFLLDNFIGYVAEDGGEIKGYVGATYCLDEGEILLVAVKSDVRRKGVASQLLEKVETELCDKGVNRILLEVRRSNAAAIRCYEKFGFTILTVRKGYYQGKEDALIMEKKRD